MSCKSFFFKALFVALQLYKKRAQGILTRLAASRGSHSWNSGHRLTEQESTVCSYYMNKSGEPGCPQAVVFGTKVQEVLRLVSMNRIWYYQQSSQVYECWMISKSTSSYGERKATMSHSTRVPFKSAVLPMLAVSLVTYKNLSRREKARVEGCSFFPRSSTCRCKWSMLNSKKSQ